MRDDRFEWDDRKANANVRKHGLSFSDARTAFDDPRYHERLDDDETDEERWLLTSFVDHVLITVCYVERGKRKRIISARRANTNEIESYNRANIS